MITEEEKQQITKILKRSNKHIWTDEIILKVISNILKVRNGTINLKSYFVPNVMNYEDYFYNLNLIQFVNGIK